MATYEIRENAQFGSNEIYFASKPHADVLTALKTVCKMRWNPRKGCWYGFASQDDIIAAIGDNDDDLGGVVSDGYMGAIRWSGNKSHQYLHGSNLSKAIREEFKRYSVKGCTVSCKTYSGGQSLTVTVKSTAADFVDRDDFINNYNISDAGYWLYTSDGETVHREVFFSLDGAEQRRILRSHAAREYDNSLTKGGELNHYYLERYQEYTPDFLAKLRKINKILDTYHYDDSNGQVDYFDTNFYRTIVVKPTEVIA